MDGTRENGKIKKGSSSERINKVKKRIVQLWFKSLPLR
jgi:hypothetical protein